MTDGSSPAVVEDEVFPPTLREVMIRPRWIGVLLLCLIVAGVFAWLGQWQLARAITTDPLPPGVTEQVTPIEDVVEPGAYLPEPLVGQKVSVSGWWIDTDFLLVSGRYNDGAQGYWLYYDEDASNPPYLPVDNGTPLNGSYLGNVNVGVIGYVAVDAEPTERERAFVDCWFSGEARPRLVEAATRF